MTQTLFYIWLIATLAWIAVVALWAYNSWPHLPLDISHNDPATRAAFDSAVMLHAAKHAFIALVPPMVLLVLFRFVAPSGK
ncbi:MAG: hypothetical protein K0U74_16340 [Alphaproteobacteria bacterium]|nr:hypothetical protein [Alphaproteobacteria bacterium]